MPSLLEPHVDADGAALAIRDANGAISWTVLAQRVACWMNLLRRAGLHRGDCIACVLGNRRETFEILLAALHCGITVVPINWHLTEPEIAYILVDSGSRAVITEATYAAVVSAAASHSPATTVSLLLDGDPHPAFEHTAQAMNEVAAEGTVEQCCGSIMLYTSGTTGHPKGVINGLFVVGAPFSRVTKLTNYARVVLDVAPRGRFLLDGPWYHSSQLFFALIALLQGNRLVIRPRFDPVRTLTTIDREQITSTHLVPTQLIRLLRTDPQIRRAFRGASLRRVWHGGGPCPEDVKRQMIDWWGPVFLEYYGATEGGAVTLIDSHDWLRRPGSVGRAVVPNEVHIIDDDGVALPAGQAGRVHIRRASGHTFQYHNAPSKTQRAHLTPDMFTFGDIGYLDEAGFLFLTGRAQHLIISGGVNIYPAEVEAALASHPAVRDVAVVGLPDEEYGEKVAAIVEADPGAAQADTLPALLDAHCRRKIAGFKAPRAYYLVPRLPREATGKIRHDVLRGIWHSDAGRDTPS
ncbi:AMP-binding protein [Micromonospora sediminicola]|uniref:AMP-binding protein n=1 Tax=Micromonospora sediminicola TaxID=946078 RepID=UPI0033F6A479